jgi:hypothetical protein
MASGNHSLSTESGRHSGTTLTDKAARLWSTPMQRDGKGVPGANFSRGSLPRDTALWQTPRATDGDKGGPNQTLKGKPALTNQARNMWPTPDAGVSSGFNKGGAQGRTGAERPALARLAKLWPTPTAHNSKDTVAPAEFNRKSPELPAITFILRDRMNSISGQKSLPSDRNLNPAFVEWLMGWPIGWTDCDSQVTEWFLLKPLTLSGNSSPESEAA